MRKKTIKVLHDIVDISKNQVLKKGEIKEINYNSYWARRIKDGSIEIFKKRGRK